MKVFTFKALVKYPPQYHCFLKSNSFPIYGKTIGFYDILFLKHCQRLTYLSKPPTQSQANFHSTGPKTLVFLEIKASPNNAIFLEKTQCVEPTKCTQFVPGLLSS